MAKGVQLSLPLDGLFGKVFFGSLALWALCNSLARFARISCCDAGKRDTFFKATHFFPREKRFVSLLMFHFV